MLLAGVLLIVWVIAEIFVVIQVANAIGALLTVVLLIASLPLGVWVLRHQGAAAWRRLVVAVDEGRPPAPEVADGALVLLGGMLLIVPGFITDALALILLAPTRALLRPVLVRNAKRRVVAQTVRFAGGRTYDVDSTASDVDQPQLRS